MISIVLIVTLIYYYIKTPAYLFVLLLSIHVSCSQNWGTRVKGNGSIETENRTTSSYDAIKISGFFDVELIEGDEGNIVIEGEDNLLSYIETQIHNQTLSVKVKKGVHLKPSYGKNILITIPIESIHKITLSGSGHVEGKTLIKNEHLELHIAGSREMSLDVEAHEIESNIAGSGDLELNGNAQVWEASIAGSGDITLAGKVENQLDISISGSGDVVADQLMANDVEISISGSGDILVNCNGTLRTSVSGSGDIHYSGSPTIEKVHTSGSGSLTNV